MGVLAQEEEEEVAGTAYLAGQVVSPSGPCCHDRRKFIASTAFLLLPETHLGGLACSTVQQSLGLAC